MPEVLRVRGFRFFFFSREGHEPRHVHVEQAERSACTEPVECVASSLCVTGVAAAVSAANLLGGACVSRVGLRVPRKRTLAQMRQPTRAARSCNARGCRRP
jgi:hypothetical protein